jgi:hypothetical protein
MPFKKPRHLIQTGAESSNARQRSVVAIIGARERKMLAAPAATIAISKTKSPGAGRGCIRIACADRDDA